MRRREWAGIRWQRIAGSAFLAGTLCLAVPQGGLLKENGAPAGKFRDATLAEYQQHLAQLRQLATACAQARDMKTCDPTLVGPDDRIPLVEAGNQERRMVRYGWLRVLLYKADEPDKAEQAAGTHEPRASTEKQPAIGARPAPRTTSQLLQDAVTRLGHDLEQARAGAASEPAHPDVHAAMAQVLAGREFRNLQQPPQTDTALEKVGSWLNRMFAGFTRLRARSKWIGRALVWGFFVAVAALLAWRLSRMERRWKSRLRAPDRRQDTQAPSAQDWQVWLAEARSAAAEGRWRDAVHSLYWASIARLDSKRLWTADRARTPREYLALLAPEDPRAGKLASLTRTFERTWYGGRPTGEADFRQAEHCATSILGDMPGTRSEAG